MTEKQSRRAGHDGIVWNGIVCAILSLSISLRQIPKAVIATNMHPTVCRTTHTVSALPFHLVNLTPTLHNDVIPKTRVATRTHRHITQGVLGLTCFKSRRK